MSACTEFRRALAESIQAPEKRQALGWHEHLASCGECRDLLRNEEVLDELLASLPIPRLPVELAQRVLARLASDRGRLDALLDQEPEPVVPAGLSRRLLSGMEQQRREAALDRLLARVPEPVVPAELGQRLLAGLRSSRVPSGSPRPRPVLARTSLWSSRWTRGLAAAAVVGLVVGISFLLTRSRPDSYGGPGGLHEAGGAEDPGASALAQHQEQPQSEVDPDLLANLDLLENWDLLTSNDLDLLLEELDAVDFTLLEYEPLPAGTEEDEG